MFNFADKKLEGETNRYIEFVQQAEEKSKTTRSKQKKNVSDQVPAGFKPKSTKSHGGSKKTKTVENKVDSTDSWIGLPCPECGKGVIIKGKTSYGCSRWKEGCTFRRPFDE